MVKKFSAGKKGLIQGEYIPQNPEKYIGKHPIIFRSSWELRLMKKFDKSSSILQWASESLAVPYYDPIQKKMRRYFPDFVVIYVNAANDVIREIIEVKPAKQVLKPEPKKNKKTATYLREMEMYITNFRKWESAKHIAKKMGYKFRIITEENLF